MIAGIAKKRAIKSYINQLGKDLANRYGQSKEYTSGQVERTVNDCGYNWRHICYAHALHTSHKQFEKWHEERGEFCDYFAMREEIANDYFSGNAEALSSSDLSASEISFSDSSSGSD